MTLNPPATGARIVATGAALPETCLSNEALIARHGVDSTDDWIRSRTGIAQRYVCNATENTSTLAIEAAKAILANVSMASKASDSGAISPEAFAETIDYILVATTTPTRPFPSVAADVQAAIMPSGATCPALDIQAVCSGFLYGLSVAKGLFASGQAKRILLIGAEHMTRQLDWADRTTAVLFGDGAAGVLLEADATNLFEVSVGANGHMADALKTPNHTTCAAQAGVSMNGREVFKQAVREMSAIKTHWLPAGETLQWLIPHQANQRILTAAYEAAQQSPQAQGCQLVSTVAEHANTSAASVPLALHHAVADGRVQRGDNLYFAAFGAGFTWGHALVRF